MENLNKKIIASILIVSLILTNAGISTLAATFSKISGDALSEMVQPDDIATKYYEEYHFESKRYLFNDSDGGGESTEDDIEETSTSFNNEVDFDAESDKPYDIEEPEEEDEEGSKNEYEEEPEGDEESQNSSDEETNEETDEETEEDIESSEGKETEETDTQSSPEEESNNEESEIPEIESETNETTINESEEINLIEETSSTENTSETEESSETEEIIIEETEIASPSELPLALENAGLFGAGEGDGTHVHKICGVAEGNPCLHTEYGEHGEAEDIGDYGTIEINEYTTLAEVIDALTGVKDDGTGAPVAVDHPEYLYLTGDVTFDKNEEGAPRDAALATYDYYTIDLKRDLYLCLNGHTLTNFVFNSAGNYKLVITDCAGGGKISSVTDEVLMFAMPVQIFGVNDKITINCSRIVNMDNEVRVKQNTFYNVKFDGSNVPAFSYSDVWKNHIIRLSTNNTSATTINVIFEKCDIANWGQTGGSDINNTGTILIGIYTNGTVVFKDSNIYNNDGITSNLINTEKASYISNVYFKGRNTIHDNNMSVCTANANMFHFERSKVYVQNEGLYLYNNSKNFGCISFNIAANCTFEVEENSTLSFNNNKIAKSVSSNNTILFDVAGVFNCYGNLEVTNDKIVNCGESKTGTYLAGIRINDGKFIKFGNSKVTVTGNASFADDAVTFADDNTYSMHHLYQVYHLNRNANYMFIMNDGCKLDTGSRIEGISFPNGFSGKIMRFTTDEVSDVSLVSNIFKADTFFYNDYEVRVVSDYAKPVHRASGHKHKLCGVAEGVDCTHEEIAEHTNILEYYALQNGIALDAAKELMQGFATTDAPEHFFLGGNISASAVTTVTIKRDLYLCLNGKSITNIIFTATNNAKLYITNCGASAAIRNNLSGSRLFYNQCVQVYGVNKNITINANVFISESANANNTVFYNVTCEGSNIPTNENNIFGVDVTGDTNITLENVVVKNYGASISEKAGKTIFYFLGKAIAKIKNVEVYDNKGLTGGVMQVGKSGYTTNVTFKGENKIYNNRFDQTASLTRLFALAYCNFTVEGSLDVYDNYKTGANILLMFDGACNFTVNEGATFKFRENKLENNKNFMNISNLANNANVKLNFLGNVEITDNKYVNCDGATSGALLASVYIQGNNQPITLGSGKVIIKNNKAYIDDGVNLADDVTYYGYHAYEVYSTTQTKDALFVMASGKKFNPENSIEGIGFPIGQTGKIMKFTTAEVDDLSIVSTVFKADDYYFADVEAQVVGDYAKLVHTGLTHKHKICGVGESEACTHIETAAHTDSPVYYPLRADLDIKLKQKIIAGNAATDDVEYLYLTEDLVSDTLVTVTMLRTAYICLNGHNIKNVIFSGDGKKVCVTNCQDTKGIITHRTTTDFLFKLNVEAFGKKIGDDYNIGLNTYCVALSYSTTSNQVTLYNVDIDGTGVAGDSGKSRFYMQNSGTFIAENIKLRDCSAISQVWIYHNGKGGTMILRNIDAYNISNARSGFIYFGGDATSKLIFKGENKIHNNTSYSSNTYYITCEGGRFIIDENATLELYEITLVQSNSIYNLLKMHTGTTAYLETRAGSTLSIHDNIFYKNVNYQAFVALFSTAEHSVLGNLSIVNNKFYNCNESNKSGDYLAGINVNDGVNLKIGSGKITIKDNMAYKDEGVTLAGDTHYQHHVYQVMSGNVNNVFIQTEGTKFNTESRVYGIAYKSAASGTIMKWTNETVNEAELDMYSTCFTADTYMIEDYVVKRQGDYAVIVSSEDHTHRPCGVGPTQACLHTEIASHSEAFTYVKIGASSLANVETFIKTFTGNSSNGTGSGSLYVYLSGDISVNTVQTINPVRPVYLCLNGHTMSGFRFVGSNQVTITNCKKTMATFREILDTNICFQANTYLYGIDRNLTINTSRIMDIGGSYATTNTEALFYGVIFDGTGMNTGSGSVNSKFYFNKNNARATFENCMFTNFKRQGRMFWFHGGNTNSNIIFKDVDVATNSGTDYQLLYSDVAAINIAFKGRNRFWNNTMQGTNETARVIDFSTGKVTIEGEGLFVENNKTLGNKYLVFFYSNADFLLKEGATLRIKDNVFTNKTTSGSVNYFVEFNSNCNPKFYGNLEVIGNKLGNCGTDNTKYISALKFAMDAPIPIGGGRVIIKDNKSYEDAALTKEADDEAYPAQHMFQLLSHAKTHPLFAMAEGKKLNPESKIDGVAFYYASGTGKLLEWDTATYGSDTYHENVFIPDKFFNENIGEGVVNGYASLKYATPPEQKHDHKVCGRALSDACTHTEVAAHTKNIEYQKIGTTLKNNLDIFTYLMSSADKIPEDDMYFYLDEDIVSSKTRNITLRNNIYICLNGHKMSGFTFNTANGNTLYITNCASGVGRIEHTLSDSGIMFRLSTEIYGINRNLVPKSGSLIAYEAKNVVFYDTLFDNDGRTSNPGTTIIHTSTTGASFIIEKCKFVNFEKGLEMLKTSTNNATVILKNTEFEKCNNMASRFFQMYNSTSSRNKLIFKGENSIHDCVTDGTQQVNQIFDFGYAEVVIESGGSFKYYNNKVRTAKYRSIMWFDASDFTVKENASFEVYDNLMYKNTNTSSSYGGSTDIVCLGSAQKSFNVYGEMKVTNNVISCCKDEGGQYLAAVALLGKDKFINIGSGKITINNNRSSKWTDGTGAVDENLRQQHMFNLYSENVANVFKIQSGKKINLDSRINVTFYDSTDGKVMLWNNNTTSDLNAYSTIFTTDSYGDEEGLEVYIKNGYAVVESKDNNHIHKICGVASNSTCTHSLVSKHTGSIQYVRITKATAVDKLVSTLQGDASSDSVLYYFLKGDYNSTSEKVVTLKKDLYLCLNGHSLTGFRFAGNGKKLYICNCVENKKVSVGSKLSGNITFTTGVQVYGQNKNITVVSSRVVDQTNTYNNPTANFYSVNVDGNSSNYASGEFAVFYIEKASSVLNIEDCDFYGHKKFHFFFSPQITSTINLKNSTFRDMSNCVKSYLNLWKDKNKQVTMNLYGDIKFDNISLSGSSTTNVPANQLSGCNFNVKSKSTVSFTRWSISNYREMIRFSTNAKFNVEEGATFIVDNNVLNKTDVSGENNAIIAYHNDSTVSCNILGNFKLTNNKINNCGTKKNGTSLAAFYIERNAAGPITIGNGKIEIYNNKAYRDNGNSPANEATYTNHHMFGVYAVNKSLIFTQKAGTKMNSQSYIENVAFSTPDYSGKVAKWTTNEVNAADIGRFNQIFTADPYWDDELWTEEKDNYGVIGFGAPNHKHKVCGVATTSACLHDSIVDHTEVIGYRKISSMYTTSAEIKTLLQTGGAYVLTADIEIEKLTGTDKYLNVTPAKDLYICLNGHSFKGIIFTGGTNYTVYVTNCQNTKAKFGNAAVANPAFNNISGEIYGINKNIEVFYDRLANLTGAEAAKQRIRVHSATFTKGLGSAITDPYIYIASKSANSSFIDDCDFSGLNTHSFIRSVGERTFKMKNTTIKDMVTTNYLMHFDSGATKAYFEGNNVIDNVLYSNKSGDYFIHFGSYAANIVKITGNMSITNCESYYNTNHFIHIAGGDVSIDENSKLTIDNNKLYNTAIYGRALLYIGSNAEFDIFGDLEIKDNAFVGTRQSHSDSGLWYANSKKPITIGSTSIVITNNTTTNAKANVRNLYSYYSTGILNQKAGTKLNAYNTVIDSIAINSEDYTGVVYPIWDKDYVTGYGDVNYLDIFKADVYGGRKGIITARDGDKIIITFGDHFHKLCGTLATMSCAHKVGVEHGIGTTPDIMLTYLALRWDNMDELRHKLARGGEYFLIRKIKFDTPTVIDLEEDLYLCLTSYYIENAIFTSSAGKNVYICTCIEQFESQEDEEEEELDYDEDGKVIESPTANMGSKRNDRGEVAIVATASSAGAIFKCDAEIYSPHSLMNIYANKLFEGVNSDSYILISNANIGNDEKTANCYDFITLDSGNKLYIEGIKVATISNVDNFVTGRDVKIYMDGENTFTGLKLNKGLINVSSVSVIQTGGSLNVINNEIKRINGEQHLITIGTKSSILGNLNIQNNKIINADASNNSGIVSAVYFEEDGEAIIGNSKIVVTNNKTYSDDGDTECDVETYLYQYMYQLYSDSGNMFAQKDGTRVSEDSFTNLSFGKNCMGTVVKNWRSNGDYYEKIFIVDKNISATNNVNRAKLSVAQEGDDVIIDNKYRIIILPGQAGKGTEDLPPFTDKAVYDEPYELRDDYFIPKAQKRALEYYADQKGRIFVPQLYPNGLSTDSSKVILTCMWEQTKNKEDWIYPGEPPVKFIRKGVIEEGWWDNTTQRGKWKFGTHMTKELREELFPGEDASPYIQENNYDDVVFLKNAVYTINYKGTDLMFRFDANGCLVTGKSEANGSEYYFEETGSFFGAMRTFPINVGDEILVFDDYGRVVRSIDPETGAVTVVASAYNKLVGADTYYPELPSLVGWR